MKNNETHKNNHIEYIQEKEKFIDLDKNTSETNSISTCDEELSIDELLNKIGFTRYHVFFYIIVSLSLISDGVEIYLIYLISPILSYINGYSENFISIMNSILYFGMAMGSITSGFVTQYLGRRNGILFYLTLIAFFGTFCVTINNIVWFLICRLIVGISIGYLFNIVNSFCEILPIKYRDFIVGSIFFAIKLGIVYFIFIFFIFSKYFDLISTYKFIVLLSSIPMHVCLIIAIFFLDESPRILLWNCEYEKAFEIIERINYGGSYDFNNEEKGKLINYIERNIESEYKEIKGKYPKNIENFQKKIIKNLEKKEINDEIKVCDSSKANIKLHETITLQDKKNIVLTQKKSWNKFLEIFKGKTLSLTLIVCSLWIFNTLSLITNLYSLPIILANQVSVEQINHLEIPFITNNKTNNKMKDLNETIMMKIKNYTNNKENEIKYTSNSKSVVTNSHNLLFNGTEKIKKILISNLVPIPAEFIAGYLSSRNYFGKKNVIFAGFFFMCLFSFLMILFPDYIYLFSSGINFFSVFSFNITKLYTSLAYHTDYRDFSYGLANFASRIFSMLIPFFSNVLLNINIYGTCYVILGSSILGCLFSFLMNENLTKKAVK